MIVRGLTSEARSAGNTLAMKTVQRKVERGGEVGRNFGNDGDFFEAADGNVARRDADGVDPIKRAGVLFQ